MNLIDQTIIWFATKVIGIEVEICGGTCVVFIVWIAIQELLNIARN